MPEHVGEPGNESTHVDEGRAGRHRAPQHVVRVEVEPDAVVTRFRGRHRGPQAGLQGGVDPAAPTGGRHAAPYVYDEPAVVLAMSKTRQHSTYRQAE